ncbi:hypothetical protein NA56DRAFT_81480 [Hyaloscypha hepaticicola]|uniref:Uncharacterized protein n=1 Tax=Hyaloscypha hepaticicola TaxID=2082293 RepID=A0A2J6Q9R0_9HELO|nr:hypothetical protein NA56DRAFT_81480 [Hyaloscypha hepaticicola]
MQSWNERKTKAIICKKKYLQPEFFSPLREIYGQVAFAPLNCFKDCIRAPTKRNHNPTQHFKIIFLETLKNMGLRAPRTRKREMSSASGEVIDELRRTTEAQGRCISNQQKIIEKLLERLYTVALWMEVDDLIWSNSGVKPLYIHPVYKPQLYSVHCITDSNIYCKYYWSRG